jgi:hypothetical protein
MDPVRLASFIRGIADYIDFYENPSRKMVNAKLRYILSSLGVSTPSLFLRRYYKDLAKSGTSALNEVMIPDIVSDIDEKISTIQKGERVKDPLEEVTGPIPGPKRKHLDKGGRKKELERLDNLKKNLLESLSEEPKTNDIYIEYVSKILEADAANAPAPSEFSDADAYTLGLGMMEEKNPHGQRNLDDRQREALLFKSLRGVDVPLSLEKRKSYFEAFVEGVRNHPDYPTIIAELKSTDPETAVTIEKQLSNPLLRSFITKLYNKSLQLYFNTIIDLIPSDLSGSVTTFPYNDSEFEGPAQESFILMVDHLVRDPLQFSGRSNFLNDFTNFVCKVQEDEKVCDWLKSNSNDIFRIWVNEVENCPEYKVVVDRYINVEVR